MFSRRFTYLLQTSIFLMLATGCGASVKSTIALPDLKVANGAATESSSGSTFLFIDELIDKRENMTIAKVDGREIQGSGSVTKVVADGLKAALTNKGFAFSDSAPVIISGEIRVWRADISGTLPTKVSSEAALFVEVLDPANKRIYSGVYRGFAQLEEGSINDEDVRKVLGNAMEEAVVQVSNDSQLVTLLSSY